MSVDEFQYNFYQSDPLHGIKEAAMRAIDIIEHKRDGLELSEDEIRFWVHGITSGEIPDYQLSAWAMAVLWRGMTLPETTALTLALADSGERNDLTSIVPFAIDKHSTGGVGDKTTLVVEPLVAACGVAVAKLSGRGLGASGGTIDKLESIPGFRTDLSRAEFMNQIKRIGLALCSQTAELAPADGKLYALRDVTGTVPSLPLIASSVMSKKIASGASAVVLDVKAGYGAFMSTVADAEELARWMVRIGKRAGLQTVALVSGMFQPLGNAVGNALEVREAIDTMRGAGPDSFHEHCLTVAAHMLLLAGKAAQMRTARALAVSVLEKGEALAKFRLLVEAQGGDPRVCDDPIGVLPSAPCRGFMSAERSGWVSETHAGRIGVAAVALGAGRAKKGDRIDPSVGFILRAKVGDPIQKGDALCEIHAGTPDALHQAQMDLRSAFVISSKRVQPLPLFYKTIR
jgi:pyrimidine-nucleoside phosphorylase